MELEYEFEINDWMEFQKYHLINSSQYKRTKLIVTLMLPVVFSIILILEIMKSEVSSFEVVLYGFVSMIWIIFYPKRMTKKMLDRAKNIMEEGDNSGIIGLHRVIFNNDEILYIEPESEKKIKWSGIKKIEETESHYFLYNTAISAIIIPKNKIESKLEQLSEILKKNIA